MTAPSILKTNAADDATDAVFLLLSLRLQTTVVAVAAVVVVVVVIVATTFTPSCQ